MWLPLQTGVPPVPPSGAGFLAGASTRFLLSHYKVFSPSGSVPVTLVKFIAALSAQLLGNLALLESLMLAGVGLWVAQVTAAVLLTFVNYLVYRLWVFR